MQSQPLGNIQSAQHWLHRKIGKHEVLPIQASQLLKNVHTEALSTSKVLRWIELNLGM